MMEFNYDFRHAKAILPFEEYTERHFTKNEVFH